MAGIQIVIYLLLTKIVMKGRDAILNHKKLLTENICFLPCELSQRVKKRTRDKWRLTASTEVHEKSEAAETIYKTNVVAVKL